MFDLKDPVLRPWSTFNGKFSGIIILSLDVDASLLKYLLRSRRVKLLVSVRKVECRISRSYLSVCLSVNNAVRCTFHVPSAI